jgi:hypothetical protein
MGCHWNFLRLEIRWGKAVKDSYLMMNKNAFIVKINPPSQPHR